MAAIDNDEAAALRAREDKVRAQLDLLAKASDEATQKKHGDLVRAELRAMEDIVDMLAESGTCAGGDVAGHRERVLKLQESARAAIVQSRRSISSRAERARAELLAGASARPEDADALKGAQEVTNTLLRARQLMATEVSRAEATLNTLQQSTQRMERTVEDHRGIHAAAEKGARVLTRMERRERCIAALTYAAVAFFALVVAYIVVRRIPGYGIARSMLFGSRHRAAKVEMSEVADLAWEPHGDLGTGVEAPACGEALPEMGDDPSSDQEPVLQDVDSDAPVAAADHPELQGAALKGGREGEPTVPEDDRAAAAATDHFGREEAAPEDAQGQGSTLPRELTLPRDDDDARMAAAAPYAQEEVAHEVADDNAVRDEL